MAPKTSEICNKLSIHRRRVNRDGVERVMRALEEATQNNANMRDPIVEQSKQRSEAFKVGEVLGPSPLTALVSLHAKKLCGGQCNFLKPREVDFMGYRFWALHRRSFSSSKHGAHRRT
jgi:hypothetical protein